MERMHVSPERFPSPCWISVTQYPPSFAHSGMMSVGRRDASLPSRSHRRSWAQLRGATGPGGTIFSERWLLVTSLMLVLGELVLISRRVTTLRGETASACLVMGAIVFMLAIYSTQRQRRAACELTLCQDDNDDANYWDRDHDAKYLTVTSISTAPARKWISAPRLSRHTIPAKSAYNLVAFAQPGGDDVDEPVLKGESFLDTEGLGFSHEGLASSGQVSGADDSSNAFETFGLLPPLLEALNEQGIRSPSPVQEAAIPRLLHGQNALIAAGTGSGKTLAYLLPIVQSLKNEEFLAESAAASDGSQANQYLQVRQAKRPRALILVPTRELAAQVIRVLKTICHHAKLSSTLVIGGENMGKQRRALEGAVDVVVASPGRLVKHRDSQNVFLGRVRHVVIDEVDTMLAQGFAPDLDRLLRPLLRGAEPPQVVAATATVTDSLRVELGEGGRLTLPSLNEISTVDLHKTINTVHHVFQDTKGEDRVIVLLDVLTAAGARAKPDARTMVFCNTVKSCRAVSHALRDAGFAVAELHGEVTSDTRQAQLDAFTAHDTTSPNTLVCTDVAARGLDLLGVEHVVSFDFPLSSADYLHRAGRTGRLRGEQLLSSKGTVTSLVTKHDRILATQLDKDLRIGAITDVDSDVTMSRKLRAGRLAEEARRQRAAKARKSRQGSADRSLNGRSTGQGARGGGAGRGRTGGRGSGRSGRGARGAAGRGGARGRGSSHRGLGGTR